MSNLANDFSVEEILALANVVNAAAKKVAQTEMAPTGVEKRKIVKSRSVDMTVRITGELGRAEDTEKDSTCTVLSKLTVALLVKRMGCTRDAALDMLAEIFAESHELSKDKTAQKQLLEETGLIEAESEFKAKVVAKMPKTPVLGKVAADVTVERVA